MRLGQTTERPTSIPLPAALPPAPHNVKMLGDCQLPVGQFEYFGKGRTMPGLAATPPSNAIGRIEPFPAGDGALEIAGHAKQRPATIS